MSAPGNTRGRRVSVWLPRQSFERFARVVGARVREAREAADLSVFQLAVRARIDGGDLRNCELGRKPPSLRMLAKIATALRCDVRELLP